MISLGHFNNKKNLNKIRRVSHFHQNRFTKTRVGTRDNHFM